MEEELISFETAKLAKEKGFDLTSYSCPCVGLPKHLQKPAPQAVLQKYLREVHNIQMILKPFYDSLEKENSFVCDVIRISDGRVIRSERLNSYEEVLEIGLQNGLTLVIM